jgi:hypothetical protein
MKEERIRKAIKFFRTFPNLSDKELYRKSVFKFCTLVEEFLNGEVEEIKQGEEAIQEVFGDVTKESGV